MNHVASSLADRKKLQGDGSRNKEVVLGRKARGYCKVTFLTGDDKALSGRLPNWGWSGNS